MAVNPLCPEYSKQTTNCRAGAGTGAPWLAGLDGGRVVPAVWNSALWFPQHDMIGLLVFEIQRRLGGRFALGDLFQEDGSAGKGEPQEESFLPPATQQARWRCSDPQAEAVKTVEQFTPKAGGRSAAHSWALLPQRGCRSSGRWEL